MRTPIALAVLLAAGLTGFILLRPWIATLAEPVPPLVRSGGGIDQPVMAPLAADTRASDTRPAFADAADYVRAGADPGAGLPGGWHFLDLVEDGVLAETNKARSRTRLAALAKDDGLQTAARAHARDMAARGFFDHVNPDSRTPTDRVSLLARLYVGGVGENIARRTTEGGSGGVLADALVAQWMGSPAHRDTLLRAGYNVLGVGVLAAGDEIYAVQVFGERVASLDGPMPLRVAPGAAIALRVVPEARLPTPNAYDLWQSERGAAAGARQPVVDGLKAPREPGQYRVRFYFPKAGSWTIADGPELIVREE
jgi:uncharacterized protein YkwD